MFRLEPLKNKLRNIERLDNHYCQIFTLCLDLNLLRKVLKTTLSFKDFFHLCLKTEPSYFHVE